MQSIRVAVAEDEFFTREGVIALLNKDPRIEVVGQVSNGRDAVSMVRLKQPDVLLLDIRMPPGIDGVEVIRQIRASGSDLRIIALTGEKRSVKAVQDAGGNGYVPKDKFQMLIPTVLFVAQTGNDMFINPDLTEAYAEVSKRVEDADLTEIEQEVWSRLRYTNAEIAEQMARSVGRIRNLVTEIYFKLGITDTGVSKRVQATEMARIYGVLED